MKVNKNLHKELGGKIMNFKKIILITLFLLSVLTISAVSASEDVMADNVTSVDDSQDVVEQSDDVASNQDELASDNDGDLVGDGESGNATSANATEEDPGAHDDFSYPLGSHIFPPSVQVKYKSSQYFQVFVYDSEGDWISNHKITIKVWTGKTAKKYTIKTNNQGVARFNTKNLKLGTHKVKILCPAGSYFKQSKEVSKIVVKKKISVYKKIIKIKDSSRGVTKSLKYGDRLESRIVKAYKRLEIKTENAGDGVHFKIQKVKFFFKNNKTGKIKTVKVYKSKCNERRCLAQTKLLKGYTPYKAKVWIFKYRTHNSYYVPY